jgi:hypothetical protein
VNAKFWVCGHVCISDAAGKNGSGIHGGVYADFVPANVLEEDFVVEFCVAQVSVDGEEVDQPLYTIVSALL